MTNPFWKESDSAAWIKEGRQKLYYVDVPVGWKYGFPKAIPVYDVLVAVALSIIFILIRKKTKYGA